MAKKGKKITSKHIAQAVRASGINTPYWTRVVGSRLEIQPLGGQLIIFDAQPTPPAHDPPPPGNRLHPSQVTVTANLPAMNRAQLRAIARNLQIPRRGSMTKAQLIKAIGATK